MGLLKGSLLFQRFKIESASTNHKVEDLVEKINLFKFRPLMPSGLDQESSGWVSFQSEYEPEKKITVKDACFDDRVVLVLRTDALKIPRPLLKALVKKSLRNYESENGKAADKIVRKEIELAETQGLREKILPKTKLVEALWSLKTNELRVFSRSLSVVDSFLELFQNTFQLRAEHRDFLARAYSEAGDLGRVGELMSISHKPIFTPKITLEATENV